MVLDLLIGPSIGFIKEESSDPGGAGPIGVVSHQAVCLLLHGHLKGRLPGPGSRA